MHFIVEYGLFIVILVVGLYIWVGVFQAAVTDYLDSPFWNTRSVWLGGGEYQIFGYTVTYQFEGYSDYSFYYVHWGVNYLRGVPVYTDEFGQLTLDGITNQNGLYIFPPLYAILYGAGIALNLDGYWGIGLLLAAFGYLTVFPTYGIAKTLSNNRHVGEAAALTYLLSPNVLYHIDFVWLNPSPFIFFFFAGFYFIIRDHRHIGTILIVTSALFKQTAWFLGIPLVVYLLLKPVKTKSNRSDEESEPEPPPQSLPKMIVRNAQALFDLKGFTISTILVVCYAGVIILPFLLTQPNMLLHMSLAAGRFPLDSLTDPPPYGVPMRLQVVPVVAGMPELAQILDFLISSYFLLTLGTVLFFGLMLVEPKRMDRPHYYFRRLLFLTMLLMLWMHLMGPRGVFKYYFTLFAPFFSIFSAGRMVTSKDEEVSFTPVMLILPLAMSLLIMVPNRNVYLVGVLLIFVGYVIVEVIESFWYVLTSPLRWLSAVIGRRTSNIRRVLKNSILRMIPSSERGTNSEPHL